MKHETTWHSEAGRWIVTRDGSPIGDVRILHELGPEAFCVFVDFQIIRRGPSMHDSLEDAVEAIIRDFIPPRTP